MSGKREHQDSDREGRGTSSSRRVKARSETSASASQIEKSETLQSRQQNKTSNISVKGRGKKAKTQTSSLSFPERLMEIMEHRDYWDAIRWSSDGCSFGINPEPFTEKVIDTHFQGGLFESMQKRLSRWGFQRVQMHIEFTGSWITYHHVLFRRGQPELFRNLSSTEMVDAMTKSKDVPSVSTMQMSPSRTCPEKADPPTSNPVHDYQIMCTSPLSAVVANSGSLQHPLSMNFVQSQGLSRLNVDHFPPTSREILHAEWRHRPNLLPLQQQQLMRYLQQVVSPPNANVALPDPAMALSCLPSLVRPQTEEERILSLLTTSGSDILDELRVARLTDGELLALYLRSRQL